MHNNTGKFSCLCHLLAQIFYLKNCQVMVSSNLKSVPVWVLKCLVKSDGFLKLIGQRLHWFANFDLIRTISSFDLISEIRSFSAMLFNKTFSDKVFDVSGISEFGIGGGSVLKGPIKRDLPFSARFLWKYFYMKIH